MTSLRTRAAALAAVAAIGFATFASGTATAAPAPAAPSTAGAPALATAALTPPTRIPGNTSIGRNQAWYSPNGKVVLAMQGDGNVVLYRDGKAIWVAQGAMPRGEFLVIQGDGNLVVYAADNTPLWNSQTGGKWGAELTIYNEGAIAVELNGKILWTSAPPQLPPCPPWGPPYPGQIIPPWCPVWPFPS